MLRKTRRGGWMGREREREREVGQILLEREGRKRGGREIEKEEA